MQAYGVSYYIEKISRRGDAYGTQGGTLDLLNWCGKNGLCQVSVDEAKRFWEDPSQAYSQQAKQQPSRIS